MDEDMTNKDNDRFQITDGQDRFKTTAQYKWDEFSDIPMNLESECIEVEWNGFQAGTHREEIWHWFEDTFGVSVAEDLMGL